MAFNIESDENDIRSQRLKILKAKLFDKKSIAETTVENISGVHIEFFEDVSLINALTVRLITIIRHKEDQQKPKSKENETNKIFDIISDAARKTLIDYLNSDEATVFSKIPKLKFIANLWLMVKSPERIDQGKSYLCGPACVLIAIARTMPESLLCMGLEVAKRGASNTIIPIQCPPNSYKNDSSLCDVLLSGIRYAANKRLGYSNYASLRVKAFTGITNPRELLKWLEMAGFENLEESMQVYGKTFGCCKAGEVSKFTQILFKIYSNKHKCRTPLEDFEHIIKRLEEGAQIILLLEGSFCDSFIEYAGTPESPSYFAGFSIDHYINISSIKMTSTSTAEICFLSYGQKHSIEINMREFLKYYRGSIIANPPKTSPALNGQMYSISQQMVSSQGVSDATDGIKKSVRKDKLKL